MAPIPASAGRHLTRFRRLGGERVPAHYAEWLAWQNRPREAFRSADRAVEILQQDGPPSPTAPALPLAVHVLAGVTRGRGGRDSAVRAVELLRSWLSLGPDPRWESFLYRELADHAVDAGVFEAALDFSRQAQSAADRTEEPRAIRTSRKVRVRVLTRLGRYQEALALLPAEEDRVPIAGFFESVERAQILLGLAERNEAQRWVARAETLIAAITRFAGTRYAHLRPRVDELARQL